MMNLLWVFISAFLLMFSILLFVPLNVFVEYNERLFIKVKVIFFSFNVNPQKSKNSKKSKGGKNPRSKFKKFFKSKNAFESAKDFKNFFIAAGKTVRYFFKKMSVKEFYLNVKVGASDVAAAALKYGQVSSAVYPLCSVVNSFANPRSYRVQVQPDFMGEKISIIFKTRVSTNLISIILVVVKFLKSYKIEIKK